MGRFQYDLCIGEMGRAVKAFATAKEGIRAEGGAFGLVREG